MVNTENVFKLENEVGDELFTMELHIWIIGILPAFAFITIEVDRTTPLEQMAVPVPAEKVMPVDNIVFMLVSSVIKAVSVSVVFSFEDISPSKETRYDPAQPTVQSQVIVCNVWYMMHTVNEHISGSIVKKFTLKYRRPEVKRF
jgi:hypothetical protein